MQRAIDQIDGIKLPPLVLDVTLLKESRNEGKSLPRRRAADAQPDECCRSGASRPASPARVQLRTTRLRAGTSDGVPAAGPTEWPRRTPEIQSGHPFQVDGIIGELRMVREAALRRRG